jgi:hypothetical protein
MVICAINALIIRPDLYLMKSEAYRSPRRSALPAQTITRKR